jgi:hypothetical protein
MMLDVLRADPRVTIRREGVPDPHGRAVDCLTQLRFCNNCDG